MESQWRQGWRFSVTALGWHLEQRPVQQFGLTLQLMFLSGVNLPLLAPPDNFLM